MACGVMSGEIREIKKYPYSYAPNCQAIAREGKEERLSRAWTDGQYWFGR